MMDNKNLVDAGIEDEVIVPNPDEFEDGDDQQEFDFIDGRTVPDPDDSDNEDVEV